MLLLLLCLGVIGPAMPERILGLFPHPGKSHFMVFEPLLHELNRRGHNLTVLSFFPAPYPPPPNYHDLSMEGIVDVHVATIDMTNFEPFYGLERVLYHYMDMVRLANHAMDICEKLMHWPALQELLEGGGPYDVILVESFNSDCVLGVAQRFGVPIVGLSSHQLLPWVVDRLGVPVNTAHMPLLVLPLGQNMNLWQRVENTFFMYFYKVWFRHQVQLTEWEILKKRLGVVPDLGEVAANMSMILVNTHHSLSGVWPLPPGVVEVGGLHMKPTEQRISEGLEKTLSAAKEGVVLVSFGSLLNSSSMPLHRVEALLGAFSRFPQTFIWKWEVDAVPSPKSDNVFFYKWLPQQALLKHPKVVAFIAHGGLLGMTEAVDSGVPMVVIPFFGDQPGNAAAAEEAGLATVLHYNQLTEENLFNALQKVLSPDMRASAARVSRVWRDRPAPPLDTAVYWVERTARLKHDQQMASRARHMPAYQLALLDVGAVLVAILVMLLLVVYLLFKSIIYCITSMCRSKKVKVN